jgi:acetyl-CoA acetyltransferase
MLNAYVFDGARTAFGHHAGALASVRPDDLVAHLLRTVAKRSPMAAQAEDVVLGCTCQADSTIGARFPNVRCGSPALGRAITGIAAF